MRAPLSRRNRLLLRLRYFDGRSTAGILNQLVLSERQFYREHQRAIRTVSQIIWDQHFAAADAPDSAHLSLADELDYLNVDSSHKVFYPREEIAAALAATRVIAEQRGIEISLRESAEPISLNVSQPVFRQFIIYLLNELIGATAVNGAIVIALRQSEGAPVIVIRSTALLVDGRGFCARLSAGSTPRELMRSLKVTLGWAVAPPEISLTFALQIHKVLIVDDNPDTVSLFKRYLANRPYQLLSASDETEALEIAGQTPLLCIILDIMLPGVDGWQILQKCKTHPETADIPVLICSVLDMQDVALSLGADAYIKKPPSREEFLSTLQAWAGVIAN